MLRPLKLSEHLGRGHHDASGVWEQPLPSGKYAYAEKELRLQVELALAIASHRVQFSGVLACPFQDRCRCLVHEGSNTPDPSQANESQSEQESALGLRFASDALTLHFFDRLVTPNSDEAFESVRGEVEPVAECLYGAASYEISRVRSEDRRKALSLSIRGSGEIAPPSALIERLSA